MVALDLSSFSSAFSLSRSAKISGTFTLTCSIFSPSASCCFQGFLLPAKFFLFLAEFLLRRPEFPDLIRRSLVANDVGLFIALEPDEIARDGFPELLDVVGIVHRARHGKGVGLAGDDDEALLVVIAVGIRKAAAVGRP